MNMKRNKPGVSQQLVPLTAPRRPHRIERIKSAFIMLVTAIAAEYSSLFAGFRSALRALKRRETQTRLAEDMLLLVLMCAALALCCTRLNSGANYSATVLPALMISLLIMGSCETCAQKMRPLGICFSVLIHIGFFLQATLSSASPEALGSFTVFSLFGVAFAFCVGLPVLRALLRQVPGAVALWVLQGAALLAYMVLLLFSRSTNGANNWISIGGVSLQLTELCKLEALLAFAIVMTTQDVPEARRFRAALSVLALHLLGLTLCNELATMLILLAVFFCMAFSLMGQTRKLLLSVVLLAVIAWGALTPCKVAYEKLHPDEEVAEAAVPELSGLERKMAAVYEKIHMRVVAVTAPDQAGDYAYQQQQALRARLLAGAFGTDYSVALPVAESDFAFVFLILRLGLVTGILVILLWALLPILAVPALEIGSAIGAAALAFLLSLLLTSLASAASACGLIPVMGLPPAFLGAGGTVTVSSYVSAVFILMSGKRKVVRS